MPSHRACSGCGAPAAFGAWCAGCVENREGVNVVPFGSPGLPWNPAAAREELDAAVARALGR